MTSREAFEAWAKTHGRIFLSRNDNGEGYSYHYTQEAWVGWQAAVKWASKRAQEACDNMDCAHRCQVGHEFKTAIKEALK